jgi:hypothetical protein
MVWKKVLMVRSKHLPEKCIKRPKRIIDQTSLFGPVMQILHFSYYHLTVPDNLVCRQNRIQEIEYTTKLKW